MPVFSMTRTSSPTCYQQGVFFANRTMHVFFKASRYRSLPSRPGTAEHGNCPAPAMFVFWAKVTWKRLVAVLVGFIVIFRVDTCHIP